MPTNHAIIIDMVVPMDIQTTSINHIIKQHHISQRMRRKLKNDGIIRINDKNANWSTLVHGGDHLTIAIEPEQEFELTPMALDIVYEDEYIIAVNKPAGLLMHPTSTVRTGTLANGILHYYNETNQAHDFHPIHRLDKDTSGIVIVAKTAVVQHAFEKQRIHFHKIYDAIVEGHIPCPTLTINWPIGRKEGSIIERCCTPEGKPARTDVVIVKYINRIYHANNDMDSTNTSNENNTPCNKTLTLVKCLLHTGRTHQIRVHLSSLGYPLAGDDIYGGSLTYINRQALHAGYLAFTHPMTGKLLILKAHMPPDMARLLE